MNYKQEEINEKNINDTFSEFEGLFQAVCDATKIERGTISSSQKKIIDKSVLAYMEKNVTPEEISRRAAVIRSSWTKGKVTPKSLLNNWDYFGEEATVQKPEYGINSSSCPWAFDENGDVKRILLADEAKK